MNTPKTEAPPLLYRRESEFFYLGYPLPLGSAEQALLLALLSAVPGLSGTALADLTGVGIKNIATAIKNINRKATAIGGRPLILSGRSCGYRLNPDL